MMMETAVIWFVLIFTIILFLIGEFVAQKRMTRNIMTYVCAFLLTSFIRVGLKTYCNIELAPMIVALLFWALILIAYFYNKKFHKETVVRKKKKK